MTAAAERPWFATPGQIEMERMLLQLNEDPEVGRIKARLKADIGATARARMPDAAARLDQGIDQWTHALIFVELVNRPARPVILWGSDEAPREWMGHRVGGSSQAGINPDMIGVMGGIEGGARYEILGRYHPDSRPVQVLIEVNQGNMAEPAKLLGTSANKTDIHNAAFITEKELVVAPDGSFRITLGGEADGPNHLELPPTGPCTIGARIMLNDWNQRACRLDIRRLDPVAPAVPDIEEVRRRIHANLYDFVRFWAGYADIWLGGVKPNTITPALGRPGGWGFLVGLNFSLAPDEAIVVTTERGGARYTGFQLTDPWLITSHVRERQVCLNNSQAVANADGSCTYVIAMSDPLVANWLDTDGMRDGFGILRWQAVPPTLTGEGLVRDFRKIRLSELASLPDLLRVTPEERRRQVAARSASYNTRTS